MVAFSNITLLIIILLLIGPVPLNVVNVTFVCYFIIIIFGLTALSYVTVFL